MTSSSCIPLFVLHQTSDRNSKHCELLTFLVLAWNSSFVWHLLLALCPQEIRLLTGWFWRFHSEGFAHCTDGGEIWHGGVDLYCFTVAPFCVFFWGGRRMAASSVSNKKLFQQPSVLYSAARYCVSDVRWCCSTSKTPHASGCTQVILQSGGWRSTTVDITAFD